MLRFLFGVVLGVILTLYVQARGDALLRAVGLDPHVVHSRLKVVRQVGHAIFKDDVDKERRDNSRQVTQQK